MGNDPPANRDYNVFHCGDRAVSFLRRYDFNAKNIHILKFSASKQGTGCVWLNKVSDYTLCSGELKSLLQTEFRARRLP